MSQSTIRSRQTCPPGLAELKALFEVVDASALLERLADYRRHVGRKGYPLKALWRAYLMSFHMNLPSTNHLHRELENNPSLMVLCGFDDLPHRTTFNRFISRLADHQDLVDLALAGMTRRIQLELPGFGEKVAVDSTHVRTHANPDREPCSDPEASWTAKTLDGKREWQFGYKYHAMADAKYGVPITGYVTTASVSDFGTLPVLLDKAKAEHEWFAPKYVMADKGYDSEANHREVLKRKAVPIIAIRNPQQPRSPETAAYKGLREGVYTKDGVPTCMGEVPMEYVKSDPTHGHLYRCRQEGCHLKNRRGVRYCHDENWENRLDNPRVFGVVRRDSDKWKELYGQRQAVERMFKSLKESRRLMAHAVRGLKHINLHATMSALTMQATALVRIQAGQKDMMRWQVRKVA